ncbi:MAG TPA: ribose-5-phosphate isomerase RpiA [Candidatus Binatia bacterium]|jgi:ribose 5-phosphate isomerase A
MSTAGTGDDPAIRAVAVRALDLVVDGTTIGLGTGRAAAAFIAGLGARVRDGLRVRGVPTSEASAAQARSLGITLVALEDADELDLTVDGADEVAPNLDLIKGFGNALVRERIVAAASRRQVILVGRDKLVAALGARGCIPVEVIPFARALVARRVTALALTPTLRLDATGTPVVTDNGNVILDCAPPAAFDARAARATEAALLAIPGVVDTGLFLGTAERVLVGDAQGAVEVMERRP